MGLRAPSNNDALKQANERLDKLIGRGYLLWLAGIGVGLIKLRADKVTLNGIQYTIENPEVIQGLIFMGVLLCYVAALGVSIIFAVQYTSFGNRTMFRRMIHAAAKPGPTFRNKSRKQIRVIKQVARRLLQLSAFLIGFILLLPLAHILLFERSALWLAIEAMFLRS